MAWYNLITIGKNRASPTLCGSSWHSTAMEVATPPVILVPKAAPMAIPSKKVCRASPTRIMARRESLRPAVQERGSVIMHSHDFNMVKQHICILLCLRSLYPTPRIGRTKILLQFARLRVTSSTTQQCFSMLFSPKHPYSQPSAAHLLMLLPWHAQTDATSSVC